MPAKITDPAFDDGLLEMLAESDVDVNRFTAKLLKAMDEVIAMDEEDFSKEFARKASLFPRYLGAITNFMKANPGLAGRPGVTIPGAELHRGKADGTYSVGAGAASSTYAKVARPADA